MRLVGEAAGRGHLDRHDRFREQVPGAIQAAIAFRSIVSSDGHR